MIATAVRKKVKVSIELPSGVITIPSGADPELSIDSFMEMLGANLDRFLCEIRHDLEIKVTIFYKAFNWGQEPCVTVKGCEGSDAWLVEKDVLNYINLLKNRPDKWVVERSR